MVCTDASLVVRSLGETVTTVESPNDSAGPILILIDDFGQGGAQRQIAMMVREFVARGREVIVARYADRDFLESEIRGAGAKVLRLEGGGRLGWMRSLVRLARECRPAVICAFLVGPATLALLSDKLHRIDAPIVVCERCTDPAGRVGVKRRMSLALYGRADAIVCNSRRQADWLVQTRPALRERVRHIGNAVDLDRFASRLRGRELPSTGSWCWVGWSRPRAWACSHAPLIFFVRAPTPRTCLRSSGMASSMADGPRALPGRRCERGGHPVPAPVGRGRSPSLIGSADALLLPSVSGEGTPNVILEAMSVGRLVIATDVGDSADIVDSESDRLDRAAERPLRRWPSALVTARDRRCRSGSVSMSLRSCESPVSRRSLPSERITDDYEEACSRGSEFRWQ